MLKLVSFAVILVIQPLLALPQDAPLTANAFEEKLRALDAPEASRERVKRAHEMAARHRFSSMQVKAIAQKLPDDSARLEFALAAYPQTLDPENFYEVYDAFSTFSKVFRLHDQIKWKRPSPGPVPTGPAPLPNQEFRLMLDSLRKESFDQNRLRLARQMLASSRGNFLSSQIRDMVGCFDFEPSKLDLARFAYDYTLDREKYFLVNDAFSFDASKRTLMEYVEKRLKATTHLPEAP